MSNSPFLKSYLHKVNNISYPSPQCPLCNTHPHNTHHLLNFTHIRITLLPLDLWTDPAGVWALPVRWTEKLAGGPQPRISGSIPSLARVKGVGRQQQPNGGNVLEYGSCYGFVCGEYRSFLFSPWFWWECLCICIVLRAFVVVVSMCLLYVGNVVMLCLLVESICLLLCCV